MAANDSNGWLVILDPEHRYLRPGERDRIRFTYLHDGWSESKSAQWASTPVLGRSEPIRGYMGSSPRVIQIQLAVPPEADNFPEAPYTRSRVIPVSSRIQSANGVTSAFLTPAERAQYGLTSIGSATGTAVADRTEQNTVNYFYQKWRVLDFIRSLVYPQYGPQTPVIYPPPRVGVFFGRWFSLIGICTSWNMVHRGPFDCGDPAYAEALSPFVGNDTSYFSRGTMTPFFTEVSMTIEEADEPYSWRDVYEGILRLGREDKKLGALGSTIG